MGGRKQKSKARLDKFYHIAKEQGYRSRAAFKLIQLNRKYNFLSKANILIDLCAAPGGWLQVAAKYMAPSSIILGIDLDPIKPVQRCQTFQEDITTPECISRIRGVIKTAKADVVLCDGAPNVGADWKKDAFTQSELILHALKLATNVLRKGGIFVTKVFRSADYNNLIWAMNKFFDKVEATKPEASRHTSAEIFVVCQKYKCPDYIDKRFFDANYVFKDNEQSIFDILTTKEVNSIEKIFEKRKNKRKTIKEGTPQNMFTTIDFDQFVQAPNPYPIFCDFNKIEWDDKLHGEKYLPMAKYPSDYKELLADLLLLGKRDVSNLIKWRDKIVKAIKKKEMAKKFTEKAEQIDYKKTEFDEEVDPEEELNKIEKKEERRKAKEREKRILQFAKRGVLPGGGELEKFEQELDEFNFTQHGEMMRGGENYYNSEDEPEKEVDKKFSLGGEHHVYKERPTKQNNFYEMEEELEKNYEIRRSIKDKNYQHERQVDKAKRLKKKALKEGGAGNQRAPVVKELELQDNEASLLAKRLMKRDEAVEVEDLEKSRWFDKDIFKVMGLQKKLKLGEKRTAPKQESDDADASDDENQYLHKEEVIPEVEANSDEELGGDDEFGGDFDGDLNAEDGFNEDLEQDFAYMTKNQIKEHYLDQKIKRKLNKKRKQDEENMDEENENESDEENDYSKMVKDMGVRKDEELINLDSDDDPFENDSYDGKYDITKPETDMEKRKKRLKKTQEKKDRKEGKAAKEIQIVPQKKFEEFDQEELAMDLAIAKKMLRKKERRELFDMGVNRYNYLDKPEDLPEWFREDERKHTGIIAPVTKEEVLAEKIRIKEINARPPKKVIEAKYRNKLRLVKKMKKFKSKAEQIYETEGLDQKTKMQTIERLRNKTKFVSKQQTKKIIPVRNFRSSAPLSRKTTGRKYKTVDTRMKQDMRAEKRNNRRVKRGIKKTANKSTTKKYNRRRRK